MGEVGNDFLDQLPGALADRYTIEREIGRGGMALVFLARDLRHDRPVAIKVLRPEFSATLMARRFFDEIRHASKLQHPGILPIHESGSAADLFFYTMPYVPGGTLRDRITNERQLPIPDVVRLTREIADAVAYANAQGIVHRDIKPENVLLSNGHAVIADFGIARAINEAGGERLTSSGLIVGTPEYMSPEQSSKDGSVDARSDVYSLACVVYEMLAGEPPFTGSTSQVVISRQMQEAPRSLRVIRHTIPEHMEAAINVALAKVPADRFVGAVQFAEAMAIDTRHMPKTLLSAHSRKTLVAGALAVVLGLATWATTRGRAQVLDPNKVMVFPLAERAGSVPTGSGETAALMIGSALEHSEPLRWLDGWTWLDSAQRAHALLVDAHMARDIARARGARFYLDGAVLGSADSSTVILRLNDAGGDSLLAQASNSAATRPGVVNQLGLRVVSQLLPRLLAPGRQVDVAALSERRPGAIADWLQGEREYRRSRFLSALTYYRRALGEDSALGLAALKGAQAANWADRNEEATTLTDAALKHSVALPFKYSAFARGLHAYLTGAADSAVRYLRQALAADSTWTEAWMMFGEAHYHLIAQPRLTDSIAEAAFDQARRLDPGFAPPLFHLAEISLRKGQISRAKSLLDEFSSVPPDSTVAIQLRLMLECVEHGPTAVQWDDEAGAHPLETLLAAKALSPGGAQLPCAEAGFAAVFASESAKINFRWGALVGLHGTYLAKGDTARAAAAIHAALRMGMEPARMLYVVGFEATGAFAPECAQLIAQIGVPRDTTSARNLWFEGVWASHLGDTATLAAAQHILNRRALNPSNRLDRMVADVMAGRLALARGDSAEARRRLSALASVGPSVDFGWRFWEPLAAEWTLLARLMLARGDYAGAIRTASVFDHQQPIGFLPFLPASLLIRRRAAQAIGNTALARQMTDRLAELAGGQDVGSQ